MPLLAGILLGVAALMRIGAVDPALRLAAVVAAALVAVAAVRAAGVPRWAIAGGRSLARRVIVAPAVDASSRPAMISPWPAGHRTAGHPPA